MILGRPNVGVLPSFVAKIIGNNYGTVQPAIVEMRECSIRVCSLGSQSELCVKYGDLSDISSYTRLISCLNGYG